MQDVIEELQGGMELFIADFVTFDLRIGLLDASPVEGTVEKVEGAEHQRDADMSHVDGEGDLGGLRPGCPTV